MVIYCQHQRQRLQRPRKRTSFFYEFGPLFRAADDDFKPTTKHRSPASLSLWSMSHSKRCHKYTHDLIPPPLPPSSPGTLKRCHHYTDRTLIPLHPPPSSQGTLKRCFKSETAPDLEMLHVNIVSLK